MDFVNKQGFTLIELMVVIIIGVLAAVAVPKSCRRTASGRWLLKPWLVVE